MSREVVDGYCYALWQTPWGSMGAAADVGGIRRIVLPCPRRGDVRDALTRHFDEAQPNDAPFAELIERTRRYFHGDRVDFADVTCILPRTDGFQADVLRACRQIPYGRTASYGELARRIGRPTAARAVAGALGRNPIPLVIPCHRVIYSDGRSGGFSAAGGVALKERLLALEGSRPT
jgi:methylated-DNA-[protein]-cysteine S-methyltransferase